MYFAIMAALAVIDQVFKYIVRTSITPGTDISILGDFLTITIHYNTGAAFSMLQGARMFLTILPLVMVVLIIVYIQLRKKAEHKLMLIALSTIGGGGIGNLIDRLLFGKVTDFISVGTFPVFNFADMCVVVGCGLVIIYLIFFENKNSKVDHADGIR